MSPGWIIAVVALVAAAIGARLGLRRMTGIVVGTATAAALAPQVGPVLSRWTATYVDWHGAIREAACWIAAYAAIAWSVSFLVVRVLGRGKPAGKPSARGRVAGGAAAAAVCGTCAWLLAGDLADILIRQLPGRDASPVVAVVRRPLEIMRACRVLSTISGHEAEMLLDRPDMRAVLEADSIERLLRTPGVVRKFSRAAEGDWGALARLADDPAVSELLNRGDFLERIREVDVVAMADEIERGRAVADRKPFDGRPRGIHNNDWVRRLAEDQELHDRLVEELGDESHHRSGEPTIRSNGRAGDDEVTAYWRRFGAVLELADGPNLPTTWLPGTDLRPPPTAEKPAK
jgi:hypothetical protein